MSNLVGKVAKAVGINALLGAGTMAIGNALLQKSDLRDLNQEKLQLQKAIANLEQKKDEFTPVGKKVNAESEKCKTLLSEVEAKTKKGINIPSIVKSALQGAVLGGIYGGAVDLLWGKFKKPPIIYKDF